MIGKQRTDEHTDQDDQRVRISPVAIGALVAANPSLAAPVIDGLLRRGETANIIAAPKVGKSWLVYDMALAVATGGQWLGRFRCEQGRVLLIDNELHAATLANRIPRVAQALEISESAYGRQIDVLPLRGRLTKGEQRQTQRDAAGLAEITKALSKDEATVREIRKATGISKERCERLLDMMEAAGTIISVQTIRRGNTCSLYHLTGDVVD